MKLSKAFLLLKNRGPGAFINKVKERMDPPSPIEFCLDVPAANGSCGNYLEVIGWAFSKLGAIESIGVFLNGRLIGNAEYGFERPDVAAALPSIAPLECGFGNLFPLEAGAFESGKPVKLQVRLKDNLGNQHDVTRRVFINLDSKATVQHATLNLPDLANAEVIPMLANSVVSVVIPTLNAGDEIAVLLSSLKSQEGCEKIEIIVVDSGSKDGTIATAETYKAKVIQIPQEAFSHSATRNLGAEAAGGNYVLFMTQDALPGSRRWLYEMVSALQNSEAVAVSCAEAPREDVDLFYRFTSWSHNCYMDISGQDKLLSWPEEEDYLSVRKNCQLNNVACLIEKAVFDKYRFQRNYAEDLDMGIRLARDGYKLAMLGSNPVIHSHNRPAYYHLRRGFVDSVSVSKLFRDLRLHRIESLDGLIGEAVTSYRALNLFVEALSEQPENTMKTADFVSLVNESLSAAFNSAGDGTERYKPAYNKYVDEKYTNFLLANSAGLWKPTNNLPLHNGNFARDLRALIGQVNKYVNECHEYADPQLITEFSETVFKVHAFNLGACMAGYFVNNSGSKTAGGDLFDELERGI